ncbi:MAG: UbiA family prenyltransferase [Nanoarchaeota archaeon]|nr:UbiA family prenyltransferase [Nanoarchaeota archaeon]
MNKINNFEKIVKFVRKYLNLFRFWEILNKVQVVIISIILYGIFIELKAPEFYLYSLLFMYTFITYGYILNTYTDFEQDIIKKKHLFSKNKIGLFTIVFLVLNIIFYFLARNYAGSFSNYSFVLYIISMFFITFYSLRPLRFKERGFIGVVIGSIMQRALPFLTLIFIYDIIIWSWLLFVTFILFVHGLLALTAHQILDYKNDIISKTKTFVVKIGLKKTRKLFICLTVLLYISLFLIPLIFGLKVFVSSLIIFLILIPEIEWTMLAYKELKNNA